MSAETGRGQHLTYAVVSAVIGLTPLGIITGWIAAYHGNQAAEKYGEHYGEDAMKTVSTIVQWIGIGEGSIFGLALLGGVFG